MTIELRTKIFKSGCTPSVICKSKLMKYAFSILFILFLSLKVHANTVVSDSIAPDKSIVYKTINDVDLSLHIFNPEGLKVTDHVPAIVFFFGGGWTGGRPEQFYEQARYFAQKGVVAISAEYRVKQKYGTTPFEAVTDAKSAIRWVRKHAEELGVNPDKIVASGGSAGGHLAACTDLIEGYEEGNEDLNISSKPNAMILYNPVLDTTEKGYGMDKVGEELKTAISPNHHIKPGVVPTIVFHGTADKTVPFENAERFDLLMKKAGNDSELEAYKGKDHGFFNGTFFRKKSADKRVYEDIMEKSYEFLVSELMDVKPSRVFSDHMVLQRGMMVPIWGTAKPGQIITVTFSGQKKNTITDEKGHWQIELDTLKTSTIGKDLVVSGNDIIRILDVLVGEVWICSGQSNMQLSWMGIPDIEALVPKAKNIRSFEVTRTVSLKEEDNVKGKWSVQPPNSAVAFSFAYFLEKESDVPVGIIHSSWGSSSLEAWMPKDMTKQFDDFNTVMQRFDADTLTQKRIGQILEKKTNRTNQEDIFLRRQPNILYNAMMKPLAPFAVRGLVWYQGERNTRYLSGMPEFDNEKWFYQVAGMKEYGAMLDAWIERYRKEWKKEDMHFMVVMLPGYGKGTVGHPEIDPQDPTAESWAWLRESQLKALELSHTSVINTIDLGDAEQVHPKDKLPIGERLALEAASKTIGLDIISEGPMMKNVKVGKRSLVVQYTNADGLKTTDGKTPTGFWIADKSMIWKPANAEIDNGEIILTSKEIKHPLYIRYAFAGKPEVNLVNGAGLPAYPFRTDSQ